MSTNRRFSTVPRDVGAASDMQALTELQAEDAASPSLPRPIAPALGDVLAKIGALPQEALFLGIASDGLPVLLNLHDPHPGPMLVAADAGAGKTAFLQMIAQSVAQSHDPQDVQFAVITNYPEEWAGLDGTPHYAGVYSVGQQRTQDYMQSLAAWAHANKNPRQSTLLLVDDLESVASLDLESIHNFRWLLLRGPSRRVWPIITLSAPRYGQVISWLMNFRTRIFGRVANLRVAEALGAENASLDQLEARIEFCLREKDSRSGPAGNWLRFWLPSY
jgi:hypothetical protein